ncbi:Sec1 family superfamily protein [Xylariales sp. PMI_506]|nr:Sec1 family superfamily protein [Xylariales sp. PMI_506]
MGVSLIDEQREIIIETIKNITQGDWKVLVIDEDSKKIIDNVVKEDDILNNNIANIERIEERRDMNPTMDAIYLISPQPHIVDCLVADLESRRYKKSFLVWTAVLDPQLRRRIDGSPLAQQLIGGFETLSIDFFPRESHLVTFRDPWSFPVLYHPACNGLVAKHMRDLAQKITGICVALGEYPKVRYYRPKAPLHEASVLCSHLARFISEELDEYAQWNPNFPPPSSRPQGILLVTDRSMDLMAPLVHEFTYQAMAHDLLSIQDADKTTFHMTVNEGTAEAEEKDMELSDKDKVWVDNRHRHMKDTIDKLMGDFQKFLDQNPHFTDANSDTTSLNAIKDMLAGLPQFQEMKEAYSLHLSMAQECMNIFQHHKLPDIASSEQTMATGLDEDFRKPKNILEAVAALLDDDAITQSDRLRLVIIYILYRDGVILEDIKRLLAHASLPPQDGEIIQNLELLGGRLVHGLKEPKRDNAPLFPIDTKNAVPNEEYALSRFQPVLKPLLEHVCRGALDQINFPYVKPPLDPNEDLIAGQGSLRAAKPMWAATGRRVPENRQRILVFMAGGATFSEARTCYEVGNAQGRDIVLATTHMLTPQLFVRQVGDLSVDKRRLDLPMDRPARRAPAHIFERPAPPQPSFGGNPRPGPGVAPPRRPPPQGGLPSAPRVGGVPPGGIAPPVQAMSSMSLSSAGSGRPNGGAHLAGSPSPVPSASSGPNKLEKKKRNFLGIKKGH